MKNGTEGRDVLGDSRKRYRARRQRLENTDRAKNHQSDCRIRYRALEEKKETIFIYSQSFNNKINHALVFPHLRQSACCHTEHSLALCDLSNCSDWLVWITLTKG